jgi:hypothetical protein
MFPPNFFNHRSEDDEETTTITYNVFKYDIGYGGEWELICEEIEATSEEAALRIAVLERGLKDGEMYKAELVKKK